MTGACHESVTAVPDAPAGPEIRRTRVQTRQIYTFSAAHCHHWFDDSASTVGSLQAYLHATSTHPRHDCVWVHSTTPCGDIASALLDTYDMAFALLACAWQIRAFGDERASERARVICQLLEDRLRADNGGWLEGNYPSEQRRQNPHMHLLEAFLALHQSDGSPRWLELAQRIIALLEDHFFDPVHGVLLEFFDSNWRPSHQGQVITAEPGHMAEWIYLLKQYSTAVGENLHPIAHHFYATVSRLGRDPHSGLLYNRVTATGRPIDGSKRLWPQAEWIKANLVMAEEGVPGAAELASEGAQQLFRRYMDGCTPGTYLDLIDADDKPVNTPCPASTLYHLTTAAVAWEEFPPQIANRRPAPAASLS
ncbi:AGE family epimerase/isomerase [Halioglobus maricola]|uniref:AGE family epimerase/isomerase n=1 Tax=Halioglobus maricola TaxID=2601894 RepID=UPI00147933C4|nr:AGE family epimerase/isomerase [Halioglobus maricola]